MRLNKSTSHAVRILIDCARSEDRLIKVADISRRLDITPQNAFKIVHLLAKAGFLARAHTNVSARARSGALEQLASTVHRSRYRPIFVIEQWISADRGCLNRLA